MTKKQKDLYKVVEARLHNYKNLDTQIKNAELDIEIYKEDYLGCKAISYTEDTVTPTNKFHSSVEDEVIKRDEWFVFLESELRKKKLEKRKIENALSCLNSTEEQFFKLYFMSKIKPTMRSVANSLHYQERNSVYDIKEKIVYKMMDMLYPNLKIQELPLFNYIAVENTH